MALKTYVSRNDKDLNLLMEYAKLFRVDNVIRRYMGCYCKMQLTSEQVNYI